MTMPLNFNTVSTMNNQGIGIQQGSTDQYRCGAVPETNRSTIFKGSTLNEGSLAGVRRSRDPREEIIQQRMVTTVRLENMNLKVPEQWRMKEAAFFRAKEIRQ